jgi:putative transposase
LIDGQTVNDIEPSKRGLAMVFQSYALDQAVDGWAYRKGVKLAFIRPGRPVKNGFIESFNERLRDECLNIHLFWSIEDACEKIEAP